MHGLIGPNGSGKTTILNVISGYYAPQEGRVQRDGATLTPRAPHTRAEHHIARTFQTPRLIGAASVLENVMIGGTADGRASFVESLLSLPRHHRDEAHLREAAMTALPRSAWSSSPPCGRIGCSMASSASSRSRAP